MSNEPVAPITTEALERLDAMEKAFGTPLAKEFKDALVREWPAIRARIAEQNATIAHLTQEMKLASDHWNETKAQLERYEAIIAQQAQRIEDLLAEIERLQLVIRGKTFVTEMEP